MKKSTTFVGSVDGLNPGNGLTPAISGSSGPSGWLLPGDRSFEALLWPYLAPYMVYVLLSGIPETLLAARWAQAVKLVLTGAVLFLFRRYYRFGVLRPGQVAVALAAFPVTLACWIGPIYLLSAGGIFDISTAEGVGQFSAFYFYLRLTNTVFLVAVFEELFVRAYVMGWLYQAGLQRRGKTAYSSVMDTLDQYPWAVISPPLSVFSVAGATIVFTIGHQPHEYLSAVLYFLFTTWVYQKTRSLWVCILIHGFTNLTVALLVRYGGMAWLW